MSTSSYKKQDAYSSNVGIPDKMAVFQECLQQFNASPVNAKKCRQLLAKLLRLIYNGESFPAQESTTLFFSISKLFQHKDSSLRQLVYLTIKELSSTSDDILMVTSSIMKDIQGNDAVYKPNAIRTLSKVLDPTTVNAAERLFKNAIVDKNPVISSAALISSYNLLPHAKEVVKRFTNETLETIQSYKSFPPTQFQLHEYYGSSTSNLPSTSYMYQYHALGLIYQLKNHDKMALMKLISSLSEGSSLKNSLSIIQLIRYINKILNDDQSLISHLYPILAGFLKHKSDMVELEACKTLINLQHLIKDDQFMQIVTTLQKLLGVPRTATRFAAIRLINKISIKHPEKIIVVNLELEGLINDTNRSISTLAITTLLKTMGAGTVDTGSTGGESVDRLITKMTSLMDEITEDFKIVIIEAIENLALKFPAKHKKLVSFLTDLLRDDGTLELKSSIVDALFDLIKFLPDTGAKQLILMNLCEFIEDCEFTELSVRILHLLGDEGPHTSNPSYYIRHIYNRLVLENSIVRSSAVIALAKFAAVCGGDVSKNIVILLERCLNDVDDEVRDRAAISLNFINNGKKNLIVSDSRYDLNALESKLVHYLNNEENFSVKFDISEIRVISSEELKSIEYDRKISKLESSNVENNDAPEVEEQKGAKIESAGDGVANDLLKQQEYAQELAAIAEFESYGKLTKSTSVPIYLTDKENEIVVSVVKHLFAESQKLVLQYNINNTLPHTVLQDISVIAQPDNELYQEDFIVPLAELKPDQTGIVYVSFSAPGIQDEELLSAFGNTVAYTNKDLDDEGNVDPTDDGWSDEYQIDDLELLAGDFIIPLYNSNFTSIFDQLPNQDSGVVNISNVDTIENAVNKVKTALNMMPLDGSDYVPSDITSHTLKLLGKDVWGGKVGASIRLASTGGKIVAKVEAKTDTENFANVVISSVY
ncbi:coatomer gamma subunit (Gamma-coat) protein, putative [Candida dubliniensis CD36]|uniref:Coatomer subunit gamma n=1 Tax=Candida dubliniensis (strain CD36 / ATCC MYA-646 / CBS 7987 / NCPF 3949 / NRRL Y-17841) TaxID=573826 RepID=B9W7Q6_CANDC|nr:coatomer gamma subunit (Gamma-coat) protein, putative [Candida dubliniensis CD36]CAX44717.1 coatomer gamma subunit (Gamma-coat) protein, putative [Candida dubliniensis CD36]